MSVSESTINNPKKQLEFYKDLSEQLQHENKQLSENNQEMQLEMARTWEKIKQRDEVIDEAIDTIDKMTFRGYGVGLTFYYATSTKGEFYCRAKIIKEILQKYKGDKK